MQNSFTVIGSGFGIYGYLPALIEEGISSIILPKKYQGKISARRELTRYLPNITFTEDLEAALCQATGVAIASLPETQVHCVEKCLTYKNIKYMFIEKPVAPNIQEAIELLQQLINAKIRFRIGYVFLYAKWYTNLKTILQSNLSKGELTITWRFQAHHFVHQLKIWKRYDSQGGGVVKFYGIHIFPLLAELGYNKVISSKIYCTTEDEPTRWLGTFAGENLPVCHIEVDSCFVKPSFTIIVQQDNQWSTFNFTDPFELEDELYHQDKRLMPLRKLIQTLDNSDNEIYELYKKTNNLWQQTDVLTN